ncbi:response regulator transcription factor [Paraflavitalea speifideaquila]|uniref:response regulator transcription factor n=1 Tax=Paraflavitalea speifideaquila TaxID=3076558 RepID=UPI0028EA6624|nr:response regulator transcription factor [Paraflavitalea speifideiaquila]
MKVLIVEDEPSLAASIKTYLGNESFVCEIAPNFDTALDKIALYDYTCIVLDITLPGGCGLYLLQQLKAANKSDGVLIISAKNSLDDKVEGLNAGADDYLTKPFHLPELGARVFAIIRRKTYNGNNIVQFDELQLDLAEKTASVRDIIIDLTRKEYDLLLYFISNKNRVISKQAIAAHLWGDDMDMAESFDFIYTHIKNLRKNCCRPVALITSDQYMVWDIN